VTTPQRALVVIDVQQDYFAGPLDIQYPPHAESLPRITAAIDAALAAGIPVAAVQHTMGEGAPVFDPSTPGFDLHPEVASRLTSASKRTVKEFSSIYAGTDIAAWLAEHDVDTVTLVGFMTNNCVLASAVEGEPRGFTTEVLSDATGAVHLANEVGEADARTVHTTLMTLLQSNWAAVADVATWSSALADGRSLPKSDIGSSAILGAQRAGR
jgi:nicotinamidase-related amidase